MQLDQFGSPSGDSVIGKSAPHAIIETIKLYRKPAARTAPANNGPTPSHKNPMMSANTKLFAAVGADRKNQAMPSDLRV
jgi:hypothetical protein